ncbi:MBOAT family O-acyltransferase [Tunicatimonas pelagia]|uniref:MBOAT family O-acyltransferase n=1 Tax=Tunicatimonas pelagia TaxID=931531 RepID=UPI002665539D|nr:MBOAT family O-acyltransferase [Tunicatimonas pelagia]WKN42338.1 MBOAT family O-acyltransferase [Tunicatimonas pelagia]
MVLSIILNLSVLALFKYFNFLNGILDDLLNVSQLQNPIPYLNVLLPLGISFYTFQGMSYTIDVFRGLQQPERHLGIFSTYLMFYPQLVAGPIERASHLLSQFYEKHTFKVDTAAYGLRLMLLGFFKKVVIADRLGIFVSEIYAQPEAYSGLLVLLGVVLFSFQLYCDFSGYTDIAIGAAAVMGFRLMENFNRPFIATSISDFWRRWHISLSSWINDYLYNPIAIQKRNWGKWGLIYAALFSFTLIGLWHGANWNFVIFGLLHGLALSYEILTKKRRRKLSKRLPVSFYGNLSMLLTFSFFTFSIIFFRSANVAQAFSVISNISFYDPDILAELQSMRVFDIYNLIINVLLVCLILAIEKVIAESHIRNKLFKLRWVRVSTYLGCLLIIGLFGVFQNQNDFIYFQF